MKNIVEQIEKENLRSDVAAFDVGDTVRVYVKVVEGDKERIQAYEGVVIARKNGSIRETFTVRRVSYGVGIERTFPVHSPRIDRIEVMRKGKVRRAKLYYLRDLTGKASKIKEVVAGSNKDKVEREIKAAKSTKKTKAVKAEEAVAAIEEVAEKTEN